MSLAFDFEMSRSSACKNVHHLMPLLLKALAHLEVLPHREFADVEELY